MPTKIRAYPHFVKIWIANLYKLYYLHKTVPAPFIGIGHFKLSQKWNTLLLF